MTKYEKDISACCILDGEQFFMQNLITKPAVYKDPICRQTWGESERPLLIARILRFYPPGLALTFLLSSFFNCFPTVGCARSVTVGLFVTAFRCGCCPQWATPRLTSKVNWIIRLMACWISSRLGTITCGRRSQDVTLPARTTHPCTSHLPSLKWPVGELCAERAGCRLLRREAFPRYPFCGQKVNHSPCQPARTARCKRKLCVGCPG